MYLGSYPLCLADVNVFKQVIEAPLIADSTGTPKMYCNPGIRTVLVPTMYSHLRNGDLP